MHLQSSRVLLKSVSLGTVSRDEADYLKFKKGISGSHSSFQEFGTMLQRGNLPNCTLTLGRDTFSLGAISLHSHGVVALNSFL